MPKKTVAIDLGTSRSTYAYSVQGRAEQDVIIRVPDGSLTHDVLAFGRAAGRR